MKATGWVLLCGCLLLVTGLGSAQEQTAVWETFLNVNDVRGLAHDGSRLWIATAGGAVAYDPGTGQETVYHRKRECLLSDSLSSVASAPDGTIWFGTEKVGISLFDPEAQVWEPFTSLVQPIPGDQIRRLEVAGDTLYVSAAEGLAVFVGGTQSTVCLQGIDDLRCRLPSYDVRDLSRDPSGNGLWIATAAGVAHHDTLGTTTNYTGPADPSSAHRIVRHQGKWVAAFTDGIFSLDPEERIWRHLGGPTGGGNAVDLLPVAGSLLVAGASGVWVLDGQTGWSLVGDRAIPATCLLRAPDRSLWAGGHDSNEQLDGIWHLDGNEWRQVRFPGPSIRSHYRALTFDGRGVLWLSHARSGSAAMLQSFDGIHWTAPQGVNDWTFDLLFSPEGDLWLAQCCCGASGCNLRRIVGGTTEDHPPRNLRDFAYNEDGNLWCSSDQAPDNEEYAGGIWFRNAVTGLWTQITVTTPGVDLLRNRIRAVLPRGREVWIGYSDSGVHRWDVGPDRIPLTGDDGEWVLYSTEQPRSRRLISDDVTRLAAQGDRVWVGTTAGLSLIFEGGVTNIGSGFFTLPSPQVNDLLVLRDGGAWVATSSAGITRMTPVDGGFSYDTYRPPDLPHPNVEALALDPDGRTVWAGTTRGLARVTLTGGSMAGGEPLVAYPNPFVPGCAEGVRLLGFPGTGDGVIFDLSGRIVRRFENRATGDVVWDGKDASGGAVAPGLYWIRISTPEGIRGVGVGLGDGPCPQ